MTLPAGIGAVTGPFWEGTLRRWNAVGWVLYGLQTAVIVVLDPPGDRKTWSLVLLGVLAGCYAVVTAFPGHRVLLGTPTCGCSSSRSAASPISGTGTRPCSW